MALVQRANVVLEIEDDNVERYLAKGFSVIDEKGNVLKSARPTTPEQFEKAYDEQRRINNDLKLEIEQLKKENAQLKEQIKSKPVTKKPNNTAKRKAE